MLQQIINFLNMHITYIFEEHADYLLKAVNYLQKYKDVQKTTSKYGVHYTNCPWSSNEATCDPDTCGCYKVHEYSTRSNLIILHYESLFKKELYV